MTTLTIMKNVKRGRPKLENSKIQIRTRKNDFEVFQTTFEEYKKINPKATVGTFLIFIVNFYRMYKDLIALPKNDDIKAPK